MNRVTYYIQLVGFDDKANKMLNDAVAYSDSENCACMNTAHIFLAIINDTSLGKTILNNMGMSFNDMYNCYKTLVDNGDFGHSDKSFMSQLVSSHMDMMSEATCSMIAKLLSEAFREREAVTVENLFKGILDTKEEVFIKLLDYLEVTIEELEDMLQNNFTIPEPLENFVKELTNDPRIMNSTYVNTEKYTDEIIEILGRKKKPNALLVGDAGVGKTAIAEAFAQRVSEGNVPEFLTNAHVCTVEGSVLTAGTRYRGDFEARVKMLLNFIESSKAIMFIDEIHSFVNAGSGVQGAETAGNMLKTKMNEGTIRVIGATTHKEYKKFVEHDDAFCRRVEAIEVKEPSMEDALTIVMGSIEDYEDFHGVDIDNSLIKLAAKYSDRYMKSKCFPDKLYTILDHACSKAKVDGRVELELEDIHSTVSKLTGIDVSDLQDDKDKQLLQLEDTIKKSIIGQDEAVSIVSKAIRRGKCGINNPNRPVASFLFVGPTGVGKTELCRVLSKEVALGEVSFIKVDMSEYADKIAVNKFIGSAPGYVGYGEGGQLTEKVKHNPYSLILFDEIEKAHPDVFNIFLQILEDGRLTDGDGSTVDFTNCIIVMTSNAGYGADTFNSKVVGFNSGSAGISSAEKEKKAMEALEATFKPEFLNRIDNVVIFEKLGEDQCNRITRLLVNELTDRVESEKGIRVSVSDDVVNHISKNGYSDKYGARNIRREIQNTLEDELAVGILSGKFVTGSKVSITLTDDKFNFEEY